MPERKLELLYNYDAEQRLDIFLNNEIEELTRSQIKKLIDNKKVKVNGVDRKSSYKVKNRDLVEITYELSENTDIQPVNMDLNLIYEDEDIIVIDKCSGMVTHPGSGHRTDTLVNALIYNFPDIREVGNLERPGIVHRLDKETSGVMVVARNQEAYRSLKWQFKNREIDKYYIGLVWGRMPEKRNKISLPLGRHAKHSIKFSIKSKKPRDAETIYSVLEVYKDYSLLELKPITGRTHQIRVHLSSIGHPIAGDKLYGRKKIRKRCPRLFLHAARLAIKHPVSNLWREFSSSLPEDLKGFLETVKKDSG
ncbi:MAG: RluA family pseudouridine synthase [Candidatus Aminicenantaceae bacterium]